MSNMAELGAEAAGHDRGGGVLRLGASVRELLCAAWGPSAGRVLTVETVSGESGRVRPTM